jgi:hypothetical protein
VLEGLDSVAWYSLAHAFGVATDVPDQLRAMTSPDPVEADGALRDLSMRLHGDGYVHPAGTAAVPFLVEIAAASEVGLRVRTGCLLLLGTLGGAREADPGAARELLAALGRHGDALRGLLDDPEPAVRAATTGLAGRFAAPPQDWVPRLRALRDAEADPLLRAHYAVALSLAEGRPPDRGAIAEAAAESAQVAAWRDRELSGLLGLRISPATAGGLCGMLAELSVTRVLA